jgi:hypothetical protein
MPAARIAAVGDPPADGDPERDPAWRGTDDQPGRRLDEEVLGIETVCEAHGRRLRLAAATGEDEGGE